MPPENDNDPSRDPKPGETKIEKVTPGTPEKRETEIKPNEPPAPAPQ